MSESKYSRADKLLHQILLSGQTTAELLFDLEQSFFSKGRRDVSQGKHVFVSGLARAGTTVLMRLIHESGEFASLTYRDMPMVMAPNLWRKFSSSGQKEGQAEERAHGDGMQVDFDSPEALEEVFWRTFCGKSYIKSDRLIPMEADQETLEAFRIYVAHIVQRYGTSRYLSKNNNSILRLASLARAFPNAVILIPFRHPVAHAMSLQRQHKHFLDVHASDAFSEKYMRWLVHHEFGADHRRFRFNGRGTDPDLKPSDLDYWIDLWIETYRYLADQQKALGEKAAFICYDDLTNNGPQAKSVLSDILGAPLENGLALHPPADIPEVDARNLDQALDLFEQLRSRAITNAL